MSDFTGKGYRVAPAQTSSPIAWVMVVVLLAMVGCTGFADQVRHQEPEEVEPRGMEAATKLYRSMVFVFDDETEGIDLEMEEELMVISRYEGLEPMRRRRFVGQVVPAGGGIGVRITAEYQSESVGEDGEVSWEDEPRATVEEEASQIELQMARSVERLYNRGGPEG